MYDVFSQTPALFIVLIHGKCIMANSIIWCLLWKYGNLPVINAEESSTQRSYIRHVSFLLQILF